MRPQPATPEKPALLVSLLEDGDDSLVKHTHTQTIICDWNINAQLTPNHLAALTPPPQPTTTADLLLMNFNFCQQHSATTFWNFTVYKLLLYPNHLRIHCITMKFLSSNLLGVVLFAFFALLTYQMLFVQAEKSTTHHEPTTTTPKPDEYNCSRHSDSCESCVKNSPRCYYCSATKKCGVYPFDAHPTDCTDKMSDVYWKTCTVPSNVLLIVFATLGGLLLLIFLILLTWCCCIRPCVRSCRERQENKWERNRMRMQEMQGQRRAERQQQRDAIRAKYGLGGEPTYDKFWGKMTTSQRLLANSIFTNNNYTFSKSQMSPSH